MVPFYEEAQLVTLEPSPAAMPLFVLFDAVQSSSVSPIPELKPSRFRIAESID